VSPERIFVVGAGSIGLRHVRNLKRLGVRDILVHDPSPQRLELAVNEGATPVSGIDEGLARRPSGIAVCTPPQHHLDVALRGLDAGAHLFVEKPLAATAEGVDVLVERAARAGRAVLVGYNLRFHSAVRRVKTLVDTGVLGRVLSIEAHFGQYLPDSRPTQNYRDGYLAQPDSGGLVLDASHEFDCVRWIAGEAERVVAIAETVSDLGLPQADVVLASLRLRSGAVASVHVDCVRRGYSRGGMIIGSRATATWELTGGVRLFTAESGTWQDESFVPDINDMYVDEMRHWLACLRGEAAPLTDASDGLRTLKLALSAALAAKLGREIEVEG
jgi:predicted dehydrogenase